MIRVNSLRQWGHIITSMHFQSLVELCYLQRYKFESNSQKNRGGEGVLAGLGVPSSRLLVRNGGF